MLRVPLHLKINVKSIQFQFLFSTFDQVFSFLDHCAPGVDQKNFKHCERLNRMREKYPSRKIGHRKAIGSVS